MFSMWLELLESLSWHFSAIFLSNLLESYWSSPAVDGSSVDVVAYFRLFLAGEGCGPLVWDCRILDHVVGFERVVEVWGQSCRIQRWFAEGATTSIGSKGWRWQRKGFFFATEAAFRWRAVMIHLGGDLHWMCRDDCVGWRPFARGRFVEPATTWLVSDWGMALANGIG